LATAMGSEKVWKGGQEAERLLHIGAGLYIKVEYRSSDILTPLGAGYYAFLDVSNAERILGERTEEFSRLKTNIEENMSRLSERALQIRQVLERAGVVR